MSTPTIIIVTYNALPWLKQCLDSTAGYPVVVVDNASQDETLAYIREHYPQVHLLPQPQNLGFGQGNNIGIQYALQNGAESVFLLNQDAYLVGDALGVLWTTQKKHPEFGVLSPVHTNGKGDLLDYNFSCYLSAANCPEFYSDFVLQKPLKTVYDAPFVNAAGWLLSKQCLKTVGGFDPLFFHYGEDDHYCQRLHYHGLKLGVVPGAYLRHDRDLRPNRITIHSKAFFDLELRKLKLRFSNVYSELSEQNINKFQKSVYLKSFKFILLLKWRVAKRYFRLARQIKKLTPALIYSNRLHRQKAPHHLNH